MLSEFDVQVRLWVPPGTLRCTGWSVSVYRDDLEPVTIMVEDLLEDCYADEALADALDWVSEHVHAEGIQGQLAWTSVEPTA